MEKEPTSHLHLLLPVSLHEDLKAASVAALTDVSTYLRPIIRRETRKTLAKHGDPRKEGK